MKKFFFVMLLAGFNSAFAQTASGNPQFDEFYTVNDDASEPASPVQFSPVEFFQQLASQAEKLTAELVKIYSLLEFTYHQDRYGDVEEPYNRKKHFGEWIKDGRENNCYNTRAKVLIRDSNMEVTLSKNGCTVVSGEWSDPYTGEDFTDAKDIQIDHFVPLKNAYISGADNWSHAERCLYANYMGNKFHLLSVYGKENNKKSDKTPEEYMPLNRSYRCQYLAQWLKVKMIWNLGLTPPEKQTIVQLAEENDCSPSEMTFSGQELVEQRRFISQNRDLCEYAR